MSEQRDRVVLAYSGGLDTSVCIKWMQEERGLDVIAVVGDVGQEHDGLEKIHDKALRTGAKVLILDDSTSAVDTATEAKIRESLYHDLKDTTKIIIAQRISSVQEADQILVLEDGKIIGHGTHEELLKTCETYSEIYTTQIGNQSIGAGEEAAV